jgi:hypothetical protein
MTVTVKFTTSDGAATFEAQGKTREEALMLLRLSLPPNDLKDLDAREASYQLTNPLR